MPAVPWIKFSETSVLGQGVQIEVMLRKALAEGKNEYSALQYSIRGQLNSGEGWSEAGYDVEYAPRIRVAS